MDETNRRQRRGPHIPLPTVFSSTNVTASDSTASASTAPTTPPSSLASPPHPLAASPAHPLAFEGVTMCPPTTQQQPPDLTRTKVPSETEMTTPDVEMGKSKNVVVKTVEDDNNLPRLVLRNRAFHQSSNKVHIQHNLGTKIYRLLKHNWFHVFLRWPTTRSLTALMSVWTGAILIFAGVYVWYDALDTSISCGLGKVDEPMTFAAAFAFSLETCTTVGYGLPHGINSYFEEGCSSLQVIIYFQMAWSMLFNAFLITFLYNRLGRSEMRGTQVICSNKALVNMVDGQVRFQVRLFDADAKHPVVEAHVRFYCIMKERPVPRPLRLLQPDDELGGMLFLSFPTTVNHHVDLYSLLHPPTATMTMDPKGLCLRQVDGTTANRDDVICPVCGESYGTLERWKNHVRYQQIVEAKDDYPISGTHLSLDLEEVEAQAGVRASTDVKELSEYFRKNVSEVICVVEGIDPMQSGTFQSLQSYRYEDIVWDGDAMFAPCLTVVEQNHNRIFQVDLDRYHDIVPDTARIREAAAAEAEAAAAAKAAAELEAGSKVERPRHRRVKTNSNRPGDSLFDCVFANNPKEMPLKDATMTL